MSKSLGGGVYRRGQVQWIWYVADGERVYESAQTADKRAAQSKLAQRRREIREGTWVHPRGGEPSIARVTLRQYIEAWLDRRRAAKVRTVEAEANRLEVHVLPFLVERRGGKVALGDLPLSEVTRPMVRAVMAKLAQHVSAATGELLAARTQLHVYGALRVALADAVDDGLIASSPCSLKRRKGELPTLRDADPEWRARSVYSCEEAESLIYSSAIPGDRRVYFALGLFCGLRSGEIAARRWRDIAPATPLAKLTVASQIVDGDERELKVGERREVPVHPALADCLDAWRRDGWAQWFGRAPGPNDFIVPSRKGPAHPRTDTMLKRIAEDFAAAGHDRRVPSARHAMRATFLSLGEVAGANVAILRRATHSAPADVVGGYVRITWANLCAEVAKLPLGAGRSCDSFCYSPRTPGAKDRGIRRKGEGADGCQTRKVEAQTSTFVGFGADSLAAKGLPDTALNPTIRTGAMQSVTLSQNRRPVCSFSARRSGYLKHASRAFQRAA